jgi:site-specific DNA-methyltransferase (adenine-specific)
MRSGGKIELYHMDNMELMAQYPDNHFELAIVDPPYGSDNIVGGYTNGIGGRGAAKQKKYSKSLWKFSSPELKYFHELRKVSKNQIIWGANHFISKIPFDSSCWIIWDKKNENTGYADCELAWSSFNKAARKFSFRWNGMLQEDMKNKEVRIHPTQKPVALYQWILKNYAQEGDKILDTHLGSGSIAIACHKMGFDLVACEIDKDYYDGAVKRLDNERAQMVLF